MKDGTKLECLKQIEKYFFKDLKSLIIIDLNAKVKIPFNENRENRSPKF